MSPRPGCPTCTGPIRETKGLVCQTCGHDYGAPEHPAILRWREAEETTAEAADYIDAGRDLADALEAITADRDELARQVERLDHRVCEQASALEAAESALRRIADDWCLGPLAMRQIARDALERR